MKYATNAAELDPAEVRRETLHGEDYLVAPVVLVKEKVLNGGFLPFEEIQRSVVGWNGRPVSLFHPEDEQGNLLSANLPEVHDAVVYGRIFNADATEDIRGLVGEEWLHMGVARALGGDAQRTIEMLEAGEALEVSTGYFMDPVPQPGQFEGDSYSQIQTDLMPDHLANLPGGRGACSVEDGCGAPRVNTTIAVQTDGGALTAGEANEEDMGRLSHYYNHVLKGQECTCEHGDSEPATPTMDDNQTFLVEELGLSEDTVNDMSEEEVSALIDRYQDADGGGDGTDDDADTTDADAANDGGDSTDIDHVHNEVEELKAELQALREEAEAEEQARREALIDTITDNSDRWTEELLADVPVETLETLAEDVTSAGGSQNDFTGGVNGIGRAPRGESAEGNGEWDDYEPATSINWAGDEEGEA